jgi:hypothetical protein
VRRSFCLTARTTGNGPRCGVALYDLKQDLDVRELHETLLRPWLDGNDRIFADKALPLFTAAVKYAHATSEHPLEVLGRWAQDSTVNALQQATTIAPIPVQSSLTELSQSGSCRTGSL